MPLDASGVTPIFVRRAAGQGEPPRLDYGPDIGVALRHAREYRGMSIQDVADETRIRRAYIAAIEDMRLDQLPSRPFTIGYVKSYAELMGFEPGAAIARFKEASPDPDGALRAPVGVPQEKDPRLGMIGIGGAAVLACIITWNVAQRAINADAPPPSAAPEIEVMSPGVAGPVSLGAPLPAPTESTTPQLYLTPGLEAPAVAAFDLTRPGVVPEGALQQTVLPMEPTFIAKGPIFGAPANASVVTVQARKAALIVARGADGAVYFARQLNPGEAYRAPRLKGLTIETASPQLFDLYVGGQARGQLTSSQTLVEDLVPAAPAAPVRTQG
ncbi:MAG TPA: helix-turn-helix domain-containing protein [Caulobacteraceae bacterium]